MRLPTTRTAVNFQGAQMGHLRNLWEGLGCQEGAWRRPQQPCSRVWPARADTRRENSYKIVTYSTAAPLLHLSNNLHQNRKSKEAQWLSVQSLLGDCDGRPLFIVRSVFTDCLLSNPPSATSLTRATNQTFLKEGKLNPFNFGLQSSKWQYMLVPPCNIVPPSLHCMQCIYIFVRSNIFFVRKPRHLWSNLKFTSSSLLEFFSA